jgi:hypothetical protein
MTYRITVQPNKTFRGVLHFEAADYDASTALARQAVADGVAKWNFAKMSADQLNDWYEESVGYRPQVDDPELSDNDLRELCRQIVEFDAEVEAEKKL